MLDSNPQAALMNDSGTEARELSANQSLPAVTIFALPKPFGGKTDLIQRNAIQSWARLKPDVEVLLLGDEAGIKETAEELGVRHASGLKSNEHGTPLLNSAFQLAHQESTTDYLAYCNCDVILTRDFPNSIKRLSDEAHFGQFVAFGQRTDLNVDRAIDFDQSIQVERLLKECQSEGVRSSNVCKEYFIFNRQLYKTIPPFAVGRGNWDNWMIHSAKQNRVPVINLSKMVTAIHQSHDYSHASLNRWGCYVSGAEAKENRRLGGGSHIISGSTANWKLTRDGLKKELPKLINPSFWADAPRFTRLVFDLLVR
jgi:hypothetical protein